MDLKGRSLGLGRVGKLKEVKTLAELVEVVKEKLDVPHVRVVGELDRTIRKAVVIGGSVAVPFLHDSTLIGIGISVVIIIIAALNFILDFNFIEEGAENGSPKYMEWYASFGLLVTLVWLYIEIIRLLSKLANRD